MLKVIYAVSYMCQIIKTTAVVLIFNLVMHKILKHNRYVYLVKNLYVS